MVVQIFSFNNIILQPVVTLLINILDKKWIEGIDVSDKQVPVFLNLGLNLKLIIKDGKKVKEIKQYQEKWLQHVQRMDTDYQNKH